MENTSGQGKAAVFPEEAKGLVWAWRNMSWDSVEHFNRVQRRWLKAGLLVLCLMLGIVAAIFAPAVKSGAGQIRMPPERQPVALPVAPTDQSAELEPVADTRLMAPEEFREGFGKESGGSGQTGGNAGKALEAPVSRPKGRNKAAAPEKKTPLEQMIRTKFNDVMTAVIHQDSGAVTQLLDLGWWVDKPDHAGHTPLMEAVRMGDAGMAELLLKRGADPNAVGGLPLKQARHNRDAAMETLLLRYGAK